MRVVWCVSLPVPMPVRLCAHSMQRKNNERGVESSHPKKAKGPMHKERGRVCLLFFAFSFTLCLTIQALSKETKVEGECRCL